MITNDFSAIILPDQHLSLENVISDPWDPAMEYMPLKDHL